LRPVRLTYTSFGIQVPAASTMGSRTKTGAVEFSIHLVPRPLQDPRVHGYQRGPLKDYPW